MKSNAEIPEQHKKKCLSQIHSIGGSMNLEEFQGYLKGKAVEHILFYRECGGVESLEKAEIYLKCLIGTEGRDSA